MAMMQKKNIFKMTRSGQITIPKSVREQYMLKEGDYIEVIDTGNGILVRPIETQAKKLTMPQLIERAEKDLKQGHYQALTSTAEVEGFIDDL